MRTRHPVRRATSEKAGTGTNNGLTAHDEDYRKLCELLVATREREGISQTELGRLIGRDQVTAAKIESGSRRLDPVEMFFIIDALGVDIDEFVVALRKKLGFAKHGSRNAKRTR